VRGLIEIRKTDVYAKWLDGLRDIRARARVLARVERLAAGNAGDVEPVGEGVSELRINYRLWPWLPCVLQTARS
jgi:putative addiction module killer protein